MITRLPYAQLRGLAGQRRKRAVKPPSLAAAT
jgi:hypothetical protein